MVLPLAEAAVAAITDSNRPMPMTIRSKLVGSIGVYDEASLLMMASVMDLTSGSGGFDDRRQWRDSSTSSPNLHNPSTGPPQDGYKLHLKDVAIFFFFFFFFSFFAFCILRNPNLQGIDFFYFFFP